MEQVLIRSLDGQRTEFSKRRFLAVPLSGMLAWTAIGIAGAILPPSSAIWAVWLGAGSIFYMAMPLSKLTGENIMDKPRPKNAFDSLFMSTVVMALLVFAISIPFGGKDITSIPFTIGILTGQMWVPFSWTIQHWIGIFHGIMRTVLILAAWYAFPTYRFVAIPAIVVLMYAITIPVLESRWRRVNRLAT